MQAPHPHTPAATSRTTAAGRQSEGARGRSAEEARRAAAEPKAANIITFRGVCKRFGSQVVLDHFDLDIPVSRTTVVLGPSGCGKSVMLKHIVGLLRPDAGEVSFDGRRIDGLRESEMNQVRLQVGLLFQMAALFDSMSVAENIEFPLREHTTLTKAERRERVHEALATVDLAGAEQKLPAELSGGQRKRVGLARAIVLKPRVVLYDEPTTGLDPVRSDGINELIIKLKETMGVTNVVVTHDLISARKVADRVVMLQGGKVAAEGSFDDLTASDDPRVQQFLEGRYTRDVDDEVMEPVAAAPSQASGQMSGQAAGNQVTHGEHGAGASAASTEPRNNA